MIKNADVPLRRANARSRIHEAAMRTFADRGTTDVSLSDVAEAAGIARGTIYNNILAPENLFAEVAAELSAEMIERIEATIAIIDDPALRLATGVRLFVRRAHDDRKWGLFLVRFGMGRDDLEMLLEAPPVRDAILVLRKSAGRDDREREKAFVSMLVGTTLAAMSAVITGHQTWRDAGIQSAELLLMAAGLPGKDAQRIARAQLPDLAEIPVPAAQTKRRK